MALNVSAYTAGPVTGLSTTATKLVPDPGVTTILFVADAPCYLSYSLSVTDGGAIGTAVFPIPANTVFFIEVVSKPIFVAAVTSATAHILGTS